ncbi:MAG TPA: glycosyltransferase family 4 protein [Candidatus Paceibacterota bacterium]|jgi:glycosyltransferase involved in cell wall biosynthesis|nr:glycosyltransferase family 4 protein [Candidatus Paceibacterota bacterium]
MRLCIATPLYPPEPGGPATYAKTLEEGLPAYGWDIVLVKFSDVRHLPKGIRHIAYMVRVLNAGRGADAILALDPVSVGFPAAIAAGLLRVPLIVKIVGDFAWEQGVQRAGITAPLDAFVRMGRVPLLVAFLRALQQHVAQRACVIIVPSEYLKGIVSAWGIAPAKIEVVYNALPLPEAIPSESLPAQAIVSVARLVPWKGMRGLIDALAQVRRDVPDASLVIIGDGPDRASLEAYARAAAGSAVRFTGALPHAQALAHIKASGAFVLNSTYEGLSHVLIEALLLGAQVVASDAGGNPELIADGVNGLLVPAGDTDALARAIVRVLTHPLPPHAADARFALPTMLARTSAILSRV